MEERFKFDVPIVTTSLVNFKSVTSNHGSIRIYGVGYNYGEERYAADIDSIIWNGAEMLDLMQNSVIFETAYQDLKQLAIDHVQGYFGNQTEQLKFHISKLST